MHRKWAVLTGAAAVFLAASFSAKGAGAQTDQGMKVTLNYDGKLLFLKVLDIQFHVAVDPNAHSSTARIASYGILAAFKKFAINASESGAIVHGEPQPGVFQHENHDGKRNRKVEVNWTGQDVVTNATPELTFLGDPPASRAQKLSSVGYLTAILRLALADAQGPCHGAETIFNGKELSELGFSDPHPLSLSQQQQKMGLSHGLRCVAVFREVAGYKKKKGKDQNQGLNRPIEADFARLGDDGPWIPVKLQADTPLGAATIDLAKLDVTGKLPQTVAATGP